MLEREFQEWLVQSKPVFRALARRRAAYLEAMASEANEREIYRHQGRAEVLKELPNLEYSDMDWSDTHD